MPLFMDLHKASDYEVKPTVEEIKHNHIADLEVQDKYGVKFLQYWINEDAGLVFCMMEGPDKESCAAVHREAHGSMPCNVIELQGGDYITFMGDDITVNEFDIVEKADGTPDTGYRIIVVIDCISLSPGKPVFKPIHEIVKKSKGRRMLNRPSGNREMIVFSSGLSAIQCAVSILQEIQYMDDSSTEIRIGISAGEPVTDQNNFFEYGIQMANRLCDIAQNNRVIVSSLAKQLAGELVCKHYEIEKSLKILSPADERFLNRLFEETASRFYHPAFTIEVLSKSMGLSRSNLYRKITLLTGLSANSFIRELRLRKALQLIRDKYGNVTEAAYEAGFNNPSYFTRSFQKRFGILPLQVLKYCS
jgi:AraC-like DNA-binding protein